MGGASFCVSSPTASIATTLLSPWASPLPLRQLFIQCASNDARLSRFPIASEAGFVDVFAGKANDAKTK